MLSKGPHKVGLRALLDVCGLTGRDDRQLPHRLRRRAARQRRRPHEHARHRRPPAARRRRDDGRGGARAGRAARMPRTCGGSRKKRRSSRRRRRSSRPISTSAPAPCSSSPATGWHRGVIGIVASKLVDAFHRPAIVLSIDGDVAHGSCRSIPSFNMLAALESCGEVMSKFGGHKQAAGLTIETARIRELRARVNDFADSLPRARRSASASVDRRLADVPIDQRAGRLRAVDAGAVRRRQSVPDLPRRAASRSSTARGA